MWPVFFCIWGLRNPSRRHPIPAVSEARMWQVSSLKCRGQVKHTNYLSRRLWKERVGRISDSCLDAPLRLLLPSSVRRLCSTAAALHRWSSQPDTSSAEIRVYRLDAESTQGYSRTGGCCEAWNSCSWGFAGRFAVTQMHKFLVKFTGIFKVWFSLCSINQLLFHFFFFLEITTTKLQWIFLWYGRQITTNKDLGRAVCICFWSLRWCPKIRSNQLPFLSRMQ